MGEDLEKGGSFFKKLTLHIEMEGCKWRGWFKG
jgi:hypothetical protein